MINLRQLALAMGAFAYTAFSAHTVLADDIEIYVTRDLPADQRVRPNILFILDSSGSMSTEVKGTSPKQNRNQVVRAVTKKLVDELKMSGDVNVGLMRFNSEQGGRVLYPVKRLTDTNAIDLQNAIDKVNTSDWTPLSETLYEAYRYMTGGRPKYGDNSVGSSKSGNNYISPIEHSCQRSNIIFLTDGEPTRDVDAHSLINSLAASNTLWKAGSCTSKDGQCLPHLAEYMANQDMASGVAGKQTVNTYTIGFATDQTLLKNTAEAGNGKYFTTSNVSGLTEAMKSIIVEILAENTSFAAPSVAVSAYNNLGYRNDLYYALFRPAEGDRWVGNVKRYKLVKDNQGNSLVVDRNGNAAVDGNTGFFRDTARSFWSATADGKDVAKGGVAENLPNSRTVYTWTGTDRTPTANAGVTGAANLAPLSDVTGLTNQMLGAANNTERSQFIKWGQGLDPATNTARKQVADVLHNEPKLVAYRTDEDLLRVSNSQKPTTDENYQASPEQLYMFFSTNEGFIHAVDASTGVEKFAFIPKELLGNLGAYYKNANVTNKTYGMDGQITLRVEYAAEDTAAKTRSLSKAILYAGMRRGGRNYYALDVTNLNAPQLKWVIKGGVTPGFELLGQTWAEPLLSSIMVDGQPTKVLIFSGGYDTNQDDDRSGDTPNTPVNDERGNAIFIVDADSGKLLWRTSNSAEANLTINEMTNSIPAEPALVDIDGNGLLDILYAADTRGQVFRIDFDHSGTTSTARGGRVASLGGTTAQDNRRFYNAPDIALHRERGGKPHFTIALGSGYRAHPLNEDTDDRFYVLRDFNVYSAPSSYTTLTENDLTDVSSVNLSGEQAAGIRAQIAAKEARINELNAAVVTANNHLAAYKAASGHTEKYNAWRQADAEALDKQAQIDAIYTFDPYLEEHAPESRQQSSFQKQISATQTLLKEWVEADGEASSRDQLAAVYNKLANLQESLELYYQSVLTLEQELLAAQIDPEEEVVEALESQLEDLRQAYASDASERDNLNLTLPKLLDAVRSGTPSLSDALNALSTETGVDSGLDEAGLLSRNEQAKQQQLDDLADNQANDVALLAKLEAERLALAGQASGLQAELEALAATVYDATTPTPALTDEQLAAARALYGDDMTIIEAYQFLIDQAIASATEALPGLRTEINGLYAQLQPGDNYTPNLALLNDSQGWFLRLPRGEKVLAASTSFRGAVLFSTFSPRGQAVSTCGPDVGRGRFFALDLKDASAVFTKQVNGVDVPSRSFDLDHSGIPPGPTVILDDGNDASNHDAGGDNNGNANLCIGGECPPIKCGPGKRFCESTPVSTTYWREN